MATYVVLVNWTEQGIRSIKDTTSRAKAFEGMAAKVGCQVKQLFWTMGRYDLVIVLEAPDDEVISSLMLGVAALGNVRTETLRAFTAQQFDGILKRLP